MKAVIYIRTSTAEQHPEKQLNDCKIFAEQRGYEIIEVFEEKISAFKKVKREQYDAIKQLAHEGKINAVIVWALDRWVRNRDTLLDDVTMLRMNNIKLHSVKEQWLEAINIEGSFGKTIQDFLLGLVGSMAEMESQRKRERTIMAYKNHKGKKWGRAKIITKDIIEKVLNASKEGMSIRKISQEVSYWDKHGNKKFLSKSIVHKIISENKDTLHKEDSF